jgi:hypothetical protein
LFDNSDQMQRQFTNTQLLSGYDPIKVCIVAGLRML